MTDLLLDLLLSVEPSSNTTKGTATITSLYSGIYFDTGSKALIRPSSIRIIAATPNNGEGIAGVASFTQGKVKIMALKGLRDSGSGTLSGLLSCLNYAIDKGAKISSNSWGGGGGIGSGTERIWDNVLRNNPDHLFVAAAGNSDRFIDGTSYKPMTCGLKEPNLLCVASSTRTGNKSGFSFPLFFINLINCEF